jgi:hypothetical protein
MVEIRDVQLMLRPYASAAIRREAEQRHRTAGLSGPQLATSVTADQIRAALAAHAEGTPADEPTDFADAELSPTDGSMQLADDLRTLLEVAHRFVGATPTAATW